MKNLEERDSLSSRWKNAASNAGLFSSLLAQKIILNSPSLMLRGVFFARLREKGLVGGGVDFGIPGRGLEKPASADYRRAIFILSYNTQASDVGREIRDMPSLSNPKAIC